VYLILRRKFIDNNPTLTKSIKYQRNSIQRRINLHSNSIINRMPIYKWFKLGTTDADFGED